MPARSLVRPPVALALAALAMLAAAPRASAQILKVPTRGTRPLLSASADVGYYRLGSVEDGRSNSVWGFDNGVQYRASLAYELRGGASIGVAGTFAPKMSMAYYAPGCDNGCGAEADIAGLYAVFHGGAARLGLFQTFDAQVGVIRFQRFAYTGTTSFPGGVAPALPADNTDLALGIAYGIGYAFTERFQMIIAQDAMQSIHEKTALGNGARTGTTHYVTRLGLRYVLATHAPGR